MEHPDGSTAGVTARAARRAAPGVDEIAARTGTAAGGNWTS
ncbi:hypothetical protein [Rhodobium gokarnense]|uniref:Uncharacterized protein n=1 Tax=Rhodobium gokarnense TaxID=364296 RepID=A0ABT3H9W9_9HYPH|nr:hypothetical protein [Rhodobium gokarnense]MCW2307190.1 hypothetical protein [Rhodobium gokarnense]